MLNAVKFTKKKDVNIISIIRNQTKQKSSRVYIHHKCQYIEDGIYMLAGYPVEIDGANWLQV